MQQFALFDTLLQNSNHSVYYRHFLSTSQPLWSTGGAAIVNEMSLPRSVGRRNEFADRLVSEAETHWPDVVARCALPTDENDSVTGVESTKVSSFLAPTSYGGCTDDPTNSSHRTNKRYEGRAPRHSAILSTFGTLSGPLTGFGRRRAGVPYSCSAAATSWRGGWWDLMHSRVPPSVPPHALAMVGDSRYRRRPVQLSSRACDLDESLHLPATHIVADVTRRCRCPPAVDDCIARPSNGMLGRHSWSLACLQDVENGNGPLAMTSPTAGVPQSLKSNNRRTVTDFADDNNGRFQSRPCPNSASLSRQRLQPKHVLLC